MKLIHLLLLLLLLSHFPVDFSSFLLYFLLLPSFVCPRGEGWSIYRVPYRFCFNHLLDLRASRSICRPNSPPFSSTREQALLLGHVGEPQFQRVGRGFRSRGRGLRHYVSCRLFIFLLTISSKSLPPFLLKLIFFVLLQLLCCCCWWTLLSRNMNTRATFFLFSNFSPCYYEFAFF